MLKAGDIVTWTDNLYRQQRGRIASDAPEVRASAGGVEQWYLIEHEDDKSREYRPASRLTHVKEDAKTHRFEIGTIVRGNLSGDMGIVVEHLKYPKYSIHRLTTNSRVIVSENQLTGIFSGTIVTLLSLLNDFEFAVRHEEDIAKAKEAIVAAVMGPHFGKLKTENDT